MKRFNLMTDHKALIIAVVIVSLLAIGTGVILQIADVDIHQLIGEG